jgi:hypothetical protein
MIFRHETIAGDPGASDPTVQLARVAILLIIGAVLVAYLVYAV